MPCAQGLDLSHDKFIDLCVLCGCDYTGSIKGIGPKKALALIRLVSDANYYTIVKYYRVLVWTVEALSVHRDKIGGRLHKKNGRCMQLLIN